MVLESAPLAPDFALTRWIPIGVYLVDLLVADLTDTAQRNSPVTLAGKKGTAMSEAAASEVQRVKAERTEVWLAETSETSEEAT